MAADPIPFGDVYIAGRVGVTPADTENLSVNAVLDFSAAFNYVLDFTAVNQKGVIGLIRTVFIDNSDNPSEVFVTIEATQQAFTVPAHAEGYFPVTAIFTTRINLISDGGGTPKTSVVFYNYVISPVVWYKYGLNPDDGGVQGTMAEGDNVAAEFKNKPVYMGAQRTDGTFIGLRTDNADNLKVTILDGLDITQGAKADAAWNGVPGAASVVAILKSLWNAITARQGAYTDRSVVLTGASQALMGANATRRALTISNVNALNAIGVNLAGGVAAIGAAGTITIKAGDILRYESFPPSNAITVIGTAADIATAYEG